MSNFQLVYIINSLILGIFLWIFLLFTDPSGQVAFAVVTNRDVAHHIGLNESRRCVLIRTLNESLVSYNSVKFSIVRL